MNPRGDIANKWILPLNDWDNNRREKFILAELFGAGSEKWILGENFWGMRIFNCKILIFRLFFIFFSFWFKLIEWTNTDRITSICSDRKIYDIHRCFEIREKPKFHPEYNGAPKSDEKRKHAKWSLPIFTKLIMRLHRVICERSNIYLPESSTRLSGDSSAFHKIHCKRWGREWIQSVSKLKSKKILVKCCFVIQVSKTIIGKPR